MVLRQHLAASPMARQETVIFANTRSVSDGESVGPTSEADFYLLCGRSSLSLDALAFIESRTGAERHSSSPVGATDNSQNPPVFGLVRLQTEYTGSVRTHRADLARYTCQSA